MGDHTEFRESTAFMRGCLYALAFSVLVAIVLVLVLLLGVL